MGKHSKKHRRNSAKIAAAPLPVADAVDVLKKFENAKFDESVEIAIKLGIDPKNTAQAIRGAFSLPHGIGKEIRVVAFAEGAQAEAAKAAGAIEVGAEVAHPSMMKYVGRLGRVLGPQGKMPSPKSGTVADNVGQVVAEFRAGKVEFRNDAGGNVHAIIGKKSFAKEKIAANVDAFIAHVQALRPSAVKGAFIQKVSISATMSPGVRVQVASATV
jgi:large subunit ribosomal protein L1